MQCLCVAIGGSKLGIDVSRVVDVYAFRRPTPVPFAPGSVLGLLERRGEVITVVDLSVCIGGPPTVVAGRAAVVTLHVDLAGERALVGVVSEELPAILELADDEVSPRPRNGPLAGVDWLAGIGKLSDTQILLADIDKALARERLWARRDGGREPRQAPVAPPGGAAAERLVAPATGLDLDDRSLAEALWAPQDGAKRRRVEESSGFARPSRRSGSYAANAATTSPAGAQPDAVTRAPRASAYSRERVPPPPSAYGAPTLGDRVDAVQRPLATKAATRARSGYGWLVAGFLLVALLGALVSSQLGEPPRTSAPVASVLAESPAATPVDESTPPADVAPLPPVTAAAATPAPVGAAVRIGRSGRPIFEHVVEIGDTLWDLSRRFLGDPFRWPEIYGKNRDEILDPDVIQPGETLEIPAR